jgi:hypothetical protein
MLWPTLCLKRPAHDGSLIVELSAEAEVFLHRGELDLVEPAHASICEVSFSNRSSWVWRQISLTAPSACALWLTWTAIATERPDEAYTCRIAVRDMRGAMLAPLLCSSNPMRVTRRIGPEGAPSDLGQVLILILPAALPEDI